MLKRKDRCVSNAAYIPRADGAQREGLNGVKIVPPATERQHIFC